MYILFDIGGTNMRVALSRDGEKFDEPVMIPTPRDFDSGVKTLWRVANELTSGEKPDAAGGGIAGTLSRDKTTFLNSPHLGGWAGKPIQATLAEQLNCPVFVENDTAIVGLGEAVSGAGMGYPIIAYVTVSTGVGGVRIVNREIDVSAMGFEPGHQIIDAGSGLKLPEEPSFPGVDLEAYISGSALTERYHVKPYEMTDEAFWDIYARRLAFGLNNTIVHWSPDAVIIGGSMMKKIGISIERVRAHLKGILHIYPEFPIIEKASLGDFGGIHGALAFVKQKHKISA